VLFAIRTIFVCKETWVARRVVIISYAAQNSLSIVLPCGEQNKRYFGELHRSGPQSQMTTDNRLEEITCVPAVRPEIQ